MKILRAPNDNTVNRVTSVGEVEFVNGIATEFTPEQAQFFCNTQRNYTVLDIETEEEVIAAKAAVDKVAAEKIAAEKVVADKVAAEKVAAEKAAADQKLAAEKAAADKVAAENLAAEQAAAASEFILKIGEASFADVRAFAKANKISAAGSKQDIIDRIAAASGEPPADDQGKAETTDDQSTGEAETASDMEPTAEITEVEERVDLAEADHVTLVEIADQYDIEVDEAWSTEELRAALLADEGIQEAMVEVPPEGETGEAEETGESTETTEAAQDGPGGSQPAPAATTPNQGTGEPVVLPTAQDSREVVAKWCREHDVDDKGNKRTLLERIYGDERFKR